MGCWEETCAVTHSPIFIKEKVVLIVPKISYLKLTQEFQKYGPWYHEAFVQATEAIHYGTYNEYGWIKEVATPDNIRDQQPIFVLREIWEGITNNWGQYGLLSSQDRFERLWEEKGENPHYDPPKISKEDAARFFLLIEFALCARVDLTSGDKFRGHQVAYDYGEGYRTLSKLISKRAAKVHKRMNE